MLKIYGTFKRLAITFAASDTTGNCLCRSGGSRERTQKTA
jgi:hypothetical protein